MEGLSRLAILGFIFNDEALSAANFAAEKASKLKMTSKIAILDNSSKLRVGYWGYDVVKYAPLSHLMHSFLIALLSRPDLIVYLIDEKADTDPFSKQLEKGFKDMRRWIVLPSKASPQAVLKIVTNLNVHVLVDLSGYTHGNYLEVWHKYPAEC